MQNPVSVSMSSCIDNIAVTVQEEEKERVRQMSRLFPVENRGKKRRQLLRTSKTCNLQLQWMNIYIVSWYEILTVVSDVWIASDQCLTINMSHISRSSYESFCLVWKLWFVILFHEDSIAFSQRLHLWQMIVIFVLWGYTSLCYTSRDAHINCHSIIANIMPEQMDHIWPVKVSLWLSHMTHYLDQTRGSPE